MKNRIYNPAYIANRIYKQYDNVSYESIVKKGKRAEAMFEIHCSALLALHTYMAVSSTDEKTAAEALRAAVNTRGRGDA